MAQRTRAIWPTTKLAFFLLLVSGTADASVINDVLDILSLSKTVVITLAKSWNLADDTFKISEAPIPLLSRKENDIIKRINIINDKIERLTIHMDGFGIETLITMIGNLPDRLHYEFKVNELTDYIRRVDIMHKRMQLYVKDKTEFENYTLVEFAKSVVSHQSNSIDTLVQRIHETLLRKGLDGKGFLEMQVNELSKINGDLICSMKESPQQVLLNLFNTIALTELKGYTMIQFSYMLLKLYNKGNFSKESELAKITYEENLRESLNMILNAGKRASRELWICDPKVHQQGISYLEITELLQGYIQNEVDMNPDGGCWENCAAYEHTKSYGCYKNLYCKQQRRCHGTIHNCTFVDSDSLICPARKGSHRRYEYIQYENGKTLGRKMGCSQGTVQVDSWWRYLFWHCSYCACLCDEPGPNSDRYINMLPSLSNIENNMVVTGLKFIKNNRIIHLQVQEGKLLPDENIDQESLTWVPVNDYTLTDMKYQNGKHFQMLTWRERALDLHEIHKNSSRYEVVTGVRFGKIGYHLNLQVRFTQYNITTGKLIPEKSEWAGNYNTEHSDVNPRKMLNMEKLDIPIRSTGPSLPNTNSNQFLMFTNSDWDRDVAQTTVPFIDAQAVTPRRAVPLTGVGLYHKARTGFGGFVAPNIFTLDIVEKLKRSANQNGI